MSKILTVWFALLSTQLFSQGTAALSKEAANLERSLKEAQAFDKYKQVLGAEPRNINALVKSSELSGQLGETQADKNARLTYYNAAKDYADKAISVDSNSADAYYVRAVAAGKLSEVETENKKLAAEVKDAKSYADKALLKNPDHGRANYILGKWNFDMVALPWTKKAAMKVLFGGMPQATIENACRYMEKCRKLEPYFVPNFLDLAKAYKYDHKPAQAVEVLNQLVKLPVRRSADVALKAEGKKMLSEMQ